VRGLEQSMSDRRASAADAAGAWAESIIFSLSNITRPRSNPSAENSEIFHTYRRNVTDSTSFFEIKIRPRGVKLRVFKK